MDNAIPQGFRQNAAGHLVPEGTIAEHDLLRDELVKELVARAKSTQQVVTALKQSLMQDTYAFMDLLAQKYRIQPRGLKKGGKGNFSLASFDGTLKVEIANQDLVVFGPELKIAKQLVDQCIHRWSANADDNIKALIEHAFQTDAEGKLSYGRILGLTSLDIEDAEWQDAMRAIKDSLMVVGSKLYVRLYERPGPDKPFQQIVIDLAA